MTIALYRGDAAWDVLLAGLVGDGELEEAILGMELGAHAGRIGMEVQLELSALLVVRGHVDEAMRVAALTLRRHPRDARAWAMIGAVCAVVGDHERAVRACAIAVRLDPSIADAAAATSS
ncbi:MAG TPA: hypothetical protein VM261_12125 [Kofleriaceae bacterium]|nr:hypothetical protein [Kofleriaceae bacterium]